MENVGVGFRFVADLDESIAELIKRLFGLSFGGFDHQTFRNDEREVVGRRVESVVDQTLADIESADAVLFVFFGGENALVHARSVVGRWEYIFESGPDVVGVEDAVPADVAHSLLAVCEQVSEGANGHQELTIEAAHAANRLGTIVIQCCLTIHADEGRRRGERF